MTDLFIFERNELDRENWTAALAFNPGPDEEEDDDEFGLDDDDED